MPAKVSARIGIFALLWANTLPIHAAGKPDSTLSVLADQCEHLAATQAAQAVPLAARGLKQARASRDRANETRFIVCEGLVHELQGDLGVAAARYSEAASVGETVGGDALAEALFSRGALRQNGGEYAGAIADLKRAYDLYRSSGEVVGLRRVLASMASLYADANVGQFDKAIGYYRELLVLNQQTGQRSEQATNHFNLGATLDSKQAYVEALEEYRHALDLYVGLEDQESVAETRRAIGSTLAKQGQTGEAIRLINQALAYFEASRNRDGVERARLSRGIARRKAGDAVHALDDLDSARAYFLGEGNRRFLVRVDEERAQAYAELGDWQHAYAALRQQFELQHTLDRELAEDRVTQLRVQFDAERIEQANRELQAENASRSAALIASDRIRQVQWLALSLAALLLVMLCALVWRQLRKSRRLRILAQTDELTGVANRRSIHAFLDECLHSVSTRGGELAVVAFDIDHFKRINDRHGHDAGDRALRHVVTVAARALRASDRMGRIGGEEFLVVLPGAGLQVALEVSERARRSLANSTFDDVASGQRITASFGVAVASVTTNTAEAIGKLADEALYRAKRAGRNQVCSG